MKKKAERTGNGIKCIEISVTKQNFYTLFTDMGFFPYLQCFAVVCLPTPPTHTTADPSLTSYLLHRDIDRPSICCFQSSVAASLT